MTLPKYIYYLFTIYVKIYTKKYIYFQKKIYKLKIATQIECYLLKQIVE